MKKKSKLTTKSSIATRDGGGTCTYTCIDYLLMLTADYSEPGYHCDDCISECDNLDETFEIQATPDEPSDDAGSDEGGGDAGDGGEERGVQVPVLDQLVRVRSMALPKNSALYEFQSERKVLRRVRGEWAKGLYTPLEMSLKELSKFAPKVYEIVSAMAKNRSVVSFHVVVPSQKLPKGKKDTVAKKPTEAKEETVAKKGKKEKAKPSSSVASKTTKSKNKKA